MSSNSFLPCPACKFLVATDDTICKWCNADLAALRIEQTKLKPPPPGAQPLEVVLKGRKARKLLPPTPIFDAPPVAPTPPVVVPAAAPVVPTAPVAPNPPPAPSTPPPPPPVGRAASTPPAPVPTVSPLPVAVPMPAATAPLVGRGTVLATPAPTVVPATSAPVVPSAPWARPFGEPAEAPTRKRRVPAITGAVALVAVLAGASWVVMARRDSNTTPPTAATTAPPTTTPPTTASPSTTAVPATTAIDPLASWVAYSAPDGLFSVKLPQDPKVTTSTVNVATLALPLTSYDAGNVFIMTTHYPVPIPADKADAALAGGVAGLKTSLAAAGATVSNETTTTVLGRPADQGQVDSPGKPTAYYTIVLGSQDVVEVFTIGDAGVHQAMVASLQLNQA